MSGVKWGCKYYLVSYKKAVGMNLKPHPIHLKKTVKIDLFNFNRVTYYFIFQFLVSSF